METQECEVPIKKFTIPKLRSRVENTGDVSLQSFLSKLKTNSATDSNPIEYNGLSNGLVESPSKFAIPKLRKVSDDPAHSDFLLNIRKSKAESNSVEISTLSNLKTDAVISGFSSLSLNTGEASIDAYNIDLTAALHVPEPRKRTRNRDIENVKHITFEDHFIDCDEDLSGAATVDDRLKCNIDLSEMKDHTCELVAKRHSPFGKVVCGRLHCDDVPASSFFAFTRTTHNIEPFDFKTLSPDDIILQRLHGKHNVG